MKRSQGEREQQAIEQLLNISSIYSILFIYSQTSSSHIRIQLLFSNCCQTSGTRIPFSISSTKLAFLYQSFIGIPLPKFSSIGISLPILRYLVAYLGNVCCLPSSDFSIEGALPPLLGLLWWCRLCFMLLIFILRLENSRPGSLRDDLSRVEVEMSSLIWGEIENE